MGGVGWMAGKMTERKAGNKTGRKVSSDRSSARGPCPQVLQCHPRVAKGSSDRSSARRPCLQVPQGHPRVAKGGFWTVFGTATPPTGAPEASRRGEGGF